MVNALANQNVAVVSSVPGTTTDPVYKSMELHPFGPVVLIDTAGIDDAGDLGEVRVNRTRRVLRRTDLALLVVDPRQGIGEWETDFLSEVNRDKVSVLAVINKIDRAERKDLRGIRREVRNGLDLPVVRVSAEQHRGIDALRDEIVAHLPRRAKADTIAADLVSEGNLCLLVTHIDEAAPQGRLILPQVQTLRDLLDHGCPALVTKESELPLALSRLSSPPGLVICDSQVFPRVQECLPGDVSLTSFSILFARLKGDFQFYLRSLQQLERLAPQTRIIVAEACTHRVTHEDIGRVKIPRMLCSRYPDRAFIFDYCSGSDFPDDLDPYDLMLHCGGCMLNRTEVLSRLGEAQEASLPVINYGMLLAYLNGILGRALQPILGKQPAYQYCGIGDDVRVGDDARRGEDDVS